MDCGTIAKRFGGGGHEEIAGFEHRGNIEDLFRGNQDIIQAFEEDEDKEPDEDNEVSEPTDEDTRETVPVQSSSGSRDEPSEDGENS